MDSVLVARNIRYQWIVFTDLKPAKQRYDHAMVKLWMLEHPGEPLADYIVRALSE